MSPLVVVYILHRLDPWRVDAYAVLTGGWIAGAYLMYRSLPNLNHLSLKHYGWIIGYFVIVGVISFCVCYCYGPVTSDRGLDLMRCILQSIGLFLLYKISRSPAFLLYTICSSRIVLYFVRLILRGWFRYRVYYFLFPPKHMMLSEEEYVVQGSEETKLALQRLREYCLSPECNAWRTIGRLKNPTRFAEFVSTGQDLLEEEVESYEDDPSPLLTSDEDEENHSIDG
ncbi:nuclear envelope integral membrane protein 1-like [Montipora foliosa]|uniref:nuclear envelope integral membrane protein 1-like n=1 Tax=Montipora foliosa TaxID=591990 RepID=UPI0035F1CDF3